MNKYIYRIILAIYMVLIFAYIMIMSNGSLGDKEAFLVIALLPLFPIVFVIQFCIHFGTDNIIIQKFSYLFCYSALFILAAFFFLRKWLLLEFKDSENIQYKKVKKLLLLASAFLIPLHFYTYSQSIFADPDIIEYQKRLDLVPINMKKIKIENYKETPFSMWGSELPIGLIVEFDLVGENQTHLFTDFSYGYVSSAIGGGYSASRGSRCLPYDVKMETYKNSLDEKFQRPFFRDHFLLIDKYKNHIVFLCYNPFVKKNGNDNKKLFLMIEKSKELMRDAKEIAEDRRRQSSEENISVKAEIRSAELEGINKDLSSVFVQSVPKSSLIFNKNFWLNQTEHNLEKYLIASGYRDCSNDEEYKTNKNYQFFCEKTP